MSIACSFIVTWRDNCVHSYACMTLSFVEKAHKTRLAVNRFVCSRCQMVIKL